MALTHVARRNSAIYSAEVRDQIAQSLGPQADVYTIWAGINPIDEQL